MKPTTTLRRFLALAGCSLLAVSSASADTYTWANSNVTNTATTFDWFTGGPNTQATWTGGTPVSSNLNTIQFFSAPPTAVPNTTTVTQGSNLNNGGNAFQLGTLTLSGQAPSSSNQDLTMNLGGDALNFSAATGTINLDSVDVAGNGRNITWNVSNAIQLGTASSASTLTLTGNGSSAFNFSGGFTELQTGGGSKLIKSGSSTTTLSGAVTVSGGLEVNGGLLKLTNASNAITGGITLNGGTLGDNTGAISTATLNNNLITVGGVVNLGLVGGATTNGGITLNAGADLALATNNSSATVNGAVTGVGSISINRLGAGSHTQNLNSTANTFTGTVSFTGTAAVALNVNSLADSASPGAGNIRFVGSAGTNAHTFALGSGAIAPVTLDNRQIEIVSGSAAAYTINNNSSQAFSINTDLLVGATGARTLTLGGTGTGLSTFGGKIENGSGTVSISKAGTGTWLFSGDNTYTGTTTVSAGNLITTKPSALPGYDSAAKVIFSGGTVGVQVGGSGWTTGQVDTLLTNATKTSGALGIDTTNANLTQSTWTAFTTTNLGSALGLNKLGSNTLTLDQANNYVGATTVTAGALNIQNASALGTTAAGTTVLSGAALEIQNGITVGAEALTLNGSGISSGGALRNVSGTNTYGGLVTLGSASTIISNAGALNLTNTGTIIGSGFGLTVGGAGNTTINSIIGTGTGTLTKEGAGILTLGAANTYSGATTVNGGELRWGITNAIAGGALDINDGGTVNMQDKTDTVGTITIAKGGTISGTTGTLTTGSFISNNGGTMTGATLVLTNNASVAYNSMAPGSTTFQIEKLNINDSGTNVFNIADGDAAVDFDITGFVNNGGSNVGRTITKTGAGAMQFSGSTMGATGQNSISLNINQGTVLMNRAANTAFVPGVDALITVGDGIGSASSAILKFADTGGNEQLGNRPITINSDGLFELNGRSETTSGALTVNDGSITTGVGTLTLGAATNTISGASTVTGNLTLTGTAATNLTLGGTSSINGTTTFSGGNGSGITATGGASIAGTLAFGSNSRTIAVTNASDVLAISADTTGSGAITKSGLGTLVLTGSNGYSGSTTVSAGTLQIGDGTTPGTMASGSALTLGNFAIFRVLAPTSGGSSQTVASLATTASTNSIIQLTPGTSGNTTLTITSATLSTGAGSSLNFDYTAGTTVGGTVGNNYVVWNPTLTGGIIGGAYSVTDSGGIGFATTSGGNVVRLTDSGSAGLPVSVGSATGSYFVGSGYSTVDTTTPGSLVEALSGAVAASDVTVDTTGLASGANLALGTNVLTLGAGMAFNGANPYEITASGAGGLRAATSGGTLYLNNGNTSTVTINAPILANGASGLTVNGTGTTILGGANTYSGATAFNGGTLRLANQLALQNSTLTMGGGTTALVFDSSVAGNAFTLGGLAASASGTGYDIALQNNAGSPAAVALTVGGNGASTTYAGVLSGGGSLTKAGAGTLTLSGTNTFSGDVSINAGVLKTNSAANLGNSANITFTGTSKLELPSGNITLSQGFAINAGATGTLSAGYATVTINNSLAGSGTLVASGGGTSGGWFEFTSTNNTFSGNIEINSYSSGSYPAGLTLASLDDTLGSRIKMSNTTSFTYGAGAVAPLVLDNRQIESTGWEFGSSLNNNATNTSSTVTVNTDLLLSGGGTGQYANRPFTLGGSNTGNNTFAGAITNGAGYVTRLTKTGAGTWVLSGTNTYTGATTATGGFLVLDNANALPGGIGSTGGTSNLTFNGGLIGLTAASGDFTRGLGSGVTQVQFTNNGGWAAYGADRLVNLGGASAQIAWATATTGFNAKTVMFGAASATHKVTLVNPLDLGTAARTVQANDGAAAVDGELSGVLSSTSTGGGLTKTGAGTLLLSNTANSYTGATTVSAGTLSVAAIANGGVASSIGQSSNAAGNLVFDGGTLQYTGGNASTNRLFTVNAAKTATFDVTQPGTTLTFTDLTGASLNATSILRKDGPGTLDLGKTGTSYLARIDSIVVSGGTLTSTTATKLQLNVSNSAGYALTMNGDTSLGINFALDNTTAVQTVKFNGTSGTATLPGMTLSGPSGGSTSKTFDVDNGSADVDMEVTGAIGQYTSSGTTTVGLTKTGEGTLKLSGTNTYTGTTTVSTGTLLVNGSLASGSAVTVNGGILGGTGTIGGSVTVNAAGSLAPGASALTGTLAIIGNLTLTNQVNDGTGKLKFELGANGIGTSDRITVGGDLVLGGNYLNFADFDISTLAGLENGTYPLITYAGNLIGDLGTGLVGTITGAGGSRDATLQINTTTKTVALGVSNVSVGSAYDTWSGNQPFDGDLNGDGVSNGLAFLLGAATPNTNATGLLPTASQTGGNLVIRFTCLAAADRGTATLTLEYDGDLAGTWLSVPVPSAVGSPNPIVANTTTGSVSFQATDGGTNVNDDALIDVEATISDTTESASGKLFGRLKSVNPD